MHGVAVATHHAAGRRHVVGDDPVAALARELRPGVVDEMLGLGGETDHQRRPGIGEPGDGGEDVRILHQFQPGQGAGGLLDLLVAFAGGAPVGDRGGEDRHIRRQRRLDRGQHLAGALDPLDGNARRIGQPDRPRHQHHLGPGRPRRGGDGETLLAGRTVGDIAHRIDRLMGRPRGDQDAPARQRPRAGRAQHPQDGLGDLHRLRHAADAGFAGLRHFAGIGTDQRHPVAHQLRDIAPGRGVAPHQRVHRRCQQYRPVGGQQDRGGEVIGMTACHLCHQIGGRRRHHNEIAIARQPDMADVEFARRVEQAGIGAGVGERAGGQRRDELLRGIGQDAAHNKAPLLKPANQIERLIGRDPAANNQRNLRFGFCFPG